MRRGSYAFLATCALVAAGYALVPNGTGKQALFNIFGLAAGIAILAGERRNRMGWRLPWLLLALSQILFSLGDAGLQVYAKVWPGAQTYAADAAYLGGYPLMAATVLLIVQRRAAGRSWPSLLDAAIVTVGAGAAAWEYVLAPTISTSTGPLAARAIALAYPAMDVMLIAVAARLVFAGGKRPLALWGILASLGTLLVADVFYFIA